MHVLHIASKTCKKRNCLVACLSAGGRESIYSLYFQMGRGVGGGYECGSAEQVGAGVARQERERLLAQ